MRFLAGTALAAGLWLGFCGASGANDTVRLGGPSAKADVDGGTDTELVHRRYGGYYGGYRGGYYGGYRGYYGGGYGFRFASPYVSVGFYSRPYYGYGYGHRSYYYRPYYSSYYAPAYYSQPYYYGSYYYYPCAGDATIAPQVTVLQNQSQLLPSPHQPAPQYMPPATPNGTFPYDGGPVAPVPAPKTNPPPVPMPPTPQPPANGIVPIDGRLVSMPTQVGGGISPVGAATTPRSASPARIAYPAYGEEPIPAVPRKR